jgi:DNA-directed RNA polymerase beta subunit
VRCTPACPSPLSFLFCRYYGSETLYSGITGEPLTADIFLGVVYYQRLRQMVSDKYVAPPAC